MDDDRLLLIRFLDDDLSAEEKVRLQQSLTDSTELRLERERLQRLRALVATSKAESFALGFTDRVMTRIQSTGDGLEAFVQSLIALFRKVIVVLGVIALVLGAYAATRSDLFGESSFMDDSLLSTATAQDAFEAFNPMEVAP